MSTKIRWTRLADGSHRAIGLPVVIDGRGGRRDAPMMVRTPNYRDASQRDGWFWSAVVWPTEFDADGYAEFWSIPDAKAFVADNLGWVLQQADDEYDGDPALNADAVAEATRQWQERDAAHRAQQNAVKAAYDAPLTDEEQRLVQTLHDLPQPRIRRILDEARRDLT